jgi:hypothetical protein
LTNSEILFEEKQYLGHNRLGIVIRTVLTLFCFFGYYWSENPEPIEFSFLKIGNYPISHFSNSGLIFFITGVSLLILSAALTFVPHMHIKVYKGYILVDGFWTSRKVKIIRNSIVHIRKARYKKNVLKRAVYHLHNKRIIKFYTSGEDFVELIDNTGFIYRIGSQKVQEFFFSLKRQVEI